MRAGWIAPQDTLRRTLLLWMAWPSATLAKHAGYVIREGIAALITHKVLQLSNNKKERAFSFSGKQPAPTILAFLLEIWEREAAPASLQLQLTAIGNQRGFRGFVSESNATVK